MLWIYVTQDAQRANVQDVTRTITNVPLAYRNLDDTLELEQIPSHVGVNLRGPRDRVYNLQPQELQVFVDLRGLGEGTHRLPLQAQVPRGMRVESFDPQQVTVELEEVILQFIPVTLQITGEPGNGLVAGEPDIEPEQVSVRGPKSVLAGVTQVNAEIDISGMQREVKALVPLRAVDFLGREVTRVVVNPDMLEARIPIVEPQKDVSVSVVLTGEPAEGFKVADYRPIPTLITVTGRKHLLEDVEQIQAEPVSVEGATASITFEVPLIVPEGIRLSRETVQVEVIILPDS
jgi:YbbR domain-containing protein